MPRTPSTAVQAKALQYVLEARVHVAHADGRAVRASVRGSGAGSAYGQPYTVDRVAGSWACTCPAAVTCSHVLAVQVTLVLTGRGEQLAVAHEPTPDERAAAVARGNALIERIGASADFAL